MRKLFALILTSYLLALSSPFLALADDASDIKICPFGIDLGSTSMTEEEKSETYSQFYDTFNSELSEAQCAGKTGTELDSCRESLAANYCGIKENSISNYLEKGDCTAAGLVVTEIGEVIAPNVEVDDNKVVTVYSGLCCLAGSKGSDGIVTCDDTRTLYTLSYDDCDSVAINCEKRQWVIGSSGIGLVKLIVKQVFAFAAVTVGTICVSTLIYQGIKISISGVSGDISEAKNKILQALSGLILLFLSGLFLYAINPGFFG